MPPTHNGLNQTAAFKRASGTRFRQQDSFQPVGSARVLETSGWSDWKLDVGTISAFT